MCMHDTEVKRLAFPSILSNSDGEFGAKVSGVTGLFPDQFALAQR
jgi:hypothetical protein